MRVNLVSGLILDSAAAFILSIYLLLSFVYFESLNKLHEWMNGMIACLFAEEHKVRDNKYEALPLKWNLRTINGLL